MSKYQAYPEYKDSGVEWYGRIPKSWTTSRLKFEASVNMGQSPSSDDCNQEGIGLPFLQGNAEFGNKNPTPKQYCAISRKVANQGDLLFSVRAPVGALNIADQKYGIGRGLCAISHGESLSPNFLWWVIHIVRAELNSVSTGSTFEAVSAEQVENVLFFTPSLNEQEKIASFLDHETAKIDTLIDKQQQLIQLLKEKRQAVISHAVTKGLNPNSPMRDSGVEWLGEVPEHWVVLKVKYVAELTPKKSQITQTKEQTCSFVPMEKLKKDSLILDETRKISDVYDGYTFFEDEDVLLAKVTPCFENQNMVVARGLHNGIGFGSSEIFVLRCRIKNLNDFLYYRLQEEVFMTVATGEMTGAGGLKRVPSDFINNYPLALPPENERLEIVSYIQEKTLVFDRLIKQSEGAIELMQERRTALISAAVTGKIDVRHHVSRPSGNDTSEVSA